MANISEDIRTSIERWRDDVNHFALDELGMTPDPAQEELFRYFSDPSNQRIAMKACKGPGKTAGLAVCCWNFLATRAHPKIAATSISADNLSDNLWPEMAKWQARSAFLRAKFKWTKTRIFSVDHPETWWMSARSWSKSADATQQANTMAGLHADNTMAVLDESGGIPDGVAATAEGTLSTVGGEHRILQAGNPTHLTGPLYRASTNERHLWKVIEITGDPDDPRRSPRISVQWAREHIEKYGRDNPWVLVNVFGQFPPTSLNTLLGPDEVSAAMQRELPETVWSHEARLLGVDPGRFGGARSVIFPRQGYAAFVPVVMRPNRSERNWTGVLAARIMVAADKFKADAIFVDDTGGWGAGIIDDLNLAGYPVFGIPFGGSALDHKKYKNRRAEMHFLAADWVKKGGALPFMAELQREATAATYWFAGGKFVLEEKEQIQVKLGESPDLWDAFVLTFAMPIAPKTGIDWIDRKTLHAKTEPDEDTRYSTLKALMEED